MSKSGINGVQVFAATMNHERVHLSEQVTRWLQDRPHIEIDEIKVTQSSDQAFHCIAITVLFFDPHPEKSRAAAPPIEAPKRDNGNGHGSHAPRHHGR